MAKTDFFSTAVQFIWFFSFFFSSEIQPHQSLYSLYRQISMNMHCTHLSVMINNFSVCDSSNVEMM